MIIIALNAPVVSRIYSWKLYEQLWIVDSHVGTSAVANEYRLCHFSFIRHLSLSRLLKLPVIRIISDPSNLQPSTSPWQMLTGK